MILAQDGVICHYSRVGPHMRIENKFAGNSTVGSRMPIPPVGVIIGFIIQNPQFMGESLVYKTC